MLPTLSHNDLMALAIEEAKAALQTDDVPVGAVLISESGEVIGRGRNRREERGDPLRGFDRWHHREEEAILNARGFHEMDAKTRICSLYVLFNPSSTSGGLSNLETRTRHAVLS